MALRCRRALQLVICSVLLLFAEGTFEFHIGEGSFSDDSMELLDGASIDSSGSLALIPTDNPRQVSGVAYYTTPVRMLDFAYNTTGSFSTWFKSHQVPENFEDNIGSGPDPVTNIGDGFTLCFSSQRDWVGGVAGRLGLFPNGKQDPNLKLFAIEYDNWKNVDYGDPETAHVGVDVNSPKSKATKMVTSVDVDFWHGHRVDVYSWIDYNGTTKALQVSVANNNSRPATPALTYEIDLFGVVHEEMWVGFSAGSGDAYSFFNIDEWKFRSSGLPPRFAPSPAPSPAEAPAPSTALSRSSISAGLGLIVGCVVGGSMISALGALGLLIYVRQRRKAQETEADESIRHMMAQGMPDYYSYKQLSVATNAFTEASKLGEGGFGSVYRGVLPSNGLEVAVKRVSADSKQGEREFIAEVSIISQLRHRNVVQLVGWCSDKGKFLLVYELMRNGSLDNALFHAEAPENVLSWEQRMKILASLASSLQYLHEGWRQQVIHRDVKSSNIMLDDEFNSKLGDFGPTRLVDHSKNASVTIVAGTFGYIAPEASFTGKFTDKTDVYAFGAVALEIATGRRAFDVTAPQSDMSLVEMVWRHLTGGKLVNVVDGRLEGKFDIGELEVVLLLGLLCSHPDPNSRPSMRHVVQVLAGDAPVPPVPATKPLVVFSSDVAITIENLRNTRYADTSLSGPSSSGASSSFMSKSASSIGESF